MGFGRGLLLWLLGIPLPNCHSPGDFHASLRRDCPVSFRCGRMTISVYVLDLACVP